MSEYRFKAKNMEGKLVSGTVNAQNMQSAVKKLEKNGLVILQLKEEISASNEEIITNTTKINSNTFLKLREKLEFFNAINHLYKSGMPMTDVFRTIMNASRNPKIRTICFHIIRSLEKGYSPEEALSKYSEIIGHAYTVLFITGEKSGQLEDIMPRIIQNIQKQMDFSRKVISSIIYPSLILLLILTVFLLFQFFFIKVFENLMNGTGTENMGLIALSAGLKILCIYIILGILIYKLLTSKSVQDNTLNFLSKVWFIDNLFMYYNYSNFFSILSIAYEAGVEAFKIIELASGVINIPNLRRRIKKISAMIKAGSDISTAFMTSGLFSEYAVSQISAGENSGELDSAFGSVAEEYDNSLSQALQIITRSLEFILIIIAGIFTAIIAVKGYNIIYGSIFSAF